MISFFKKFGVLIVSALAVGILFLILIGVPKTASKTGCADSNINPSLYQVQLATSSKKEFRIEQAATVQLQEAGLSIRPCFPDDGALLFLFPGDDKFGIWMKDMKFPIDVVWLDKNKKIVTVEKNMQPSSYPKVFYPAEDARYVLEFATGNASELHLSPGMTLSW